MGTGLLQAGEVGHAEVLTEPLAGYKTGVSKTSYGWGKKGVKLLQKKPLCSLSPVLD